MRKTILKWLLLTVLLAYTGFMTVWAGIESKRQVCSGVEVRVASASRIDTTTRQGVMEQLRHYPSRLVGVPLSSINTQQLEDYLSRLSNLERVECVLTPARQLRIDVVPMIPEIRVFAPDGSYYINRDGKRIESDARFFVDVPVVKGNFNAKFTARSVLPLTRFVASDPFLRDLVGMVVANDPDNLILVPRIHGHVINFGDTTRLKEKKDALLAMYRKVLPYKGWETYDTISVRFRGQVVASRRNKTITEHGEKYEENVDMEEATLPTDDTPDSPSPSTVPQPSTTPV